MRLSRIDLVPLLTIVAGGVMGASLSFSFLGRSPADDVPDWDVWEVQFYSPEPEVSVDATLSGKGSRVEGERYDVSPRDELLMMLRFQDVEIVEIMAGPENARTGWSPPTRPRQ